MISKSTASLVLNVALQTGGDFAEIFLEDTTRNVIEMSSGEVSNASTSNLHGAGIRILDGFNEVYGYCNDLSKKSLVNLATSLSKSFNSTPKDIKFELKRQKAKNKHKAKIGFSTVSNETKVSYLKKISDYAMGYSPLIKQVVVSLSDETQNVWIVNSFGKMISDVRHHVRVFLTVVAGKDGRMESSHNSIGRNMGFEMVQDIEVESFAKDVCDSAITMLDSPDMVGQELPVVIHNGFGGVILHEACVHSLEATSVAKGLSVFCNKIGEQIASPIVTAIDDGTLTNNWGSENIDDEGNPTKKNVLIENGILKGYLVDYRNSRRMNCDITGSARRQNYRFSPTSRMTNTFFAKGKSTFNQIIKATKYGLFAKKMGGGSVNPVTGEFNFAVLEGYMIENGKITHPVKGATLVGSGKDTLMKIDMIGNNLTTAQGMCGSLSGSIPTDVGQPTIRVSSMVVGGKGGK
jgi:TldD protein